MAAACLASACQPGENIDEAAGAGIVPPELITTTTALETTSTTTEPATTTTVEVTTTLPILCPELSHPRHHDYCPVATTVPVSYNPAPTSGWAIPTYIVMCESGGRWDAYNASGASGPYQLMPLHFGGELAMHQSRAAQHAKAAELWDGGNGKSHWSACL